MKVTTDACLFGAWVAEKVKSQKSKIKNLLDIGTGTGLLSLMYSQKNSNCTIDAIEINEEAYEQAKENVAASPFAEQVHVMKGDVRTFLLDKKYDLIISNPPFYENELKSEKENKNIAHHGEELSLHELFVAIKKNLTDDGGFFVLLPYKRYNEIRDILSEFNLSLSELTFIRQSTKHDYFRIILQGRSGSGDVETEMNEISICDEQQQYTSEFIKLLKDYYLYL